MISANDVAQTLKNPRVAREIVEHGTKNVLIPLMRAKEVQEKKEQDRESFSKTYINTLNLLGKEKYLEKKNLHKIARFSEKIKMDKKFLDVLKKLGSEKYLEKKSATIEILGKEASSRLSKEIAKKLFNKTPKEISSKFYHEIDKNLLASFPSTNNKIRKSWKKFLIDKVGPRNIYRGITFQGQKIRPRQFATYETLEEFANFKNKVKKIRNALKDTSSIKKTLEKNSASRMGKELAKNIFQKTPKEATKETRNWLKDLRELILKGNTLDEASKVMGKRKSYPTEVRKNRNFVKIYTESKAFKNNSRRNLDYYLKKQS